MHKKLTSTTSSSAEIPIKDLGPPGMPGHLFFVDVYKGETRTDHDRLRDESERDFEVAALIGKSAPLEPGFNMSIDPERGSSYLLANADAVTTIVRGPFGEISLAHNSRRELSVARYKCRAKTAALARVKFAEAITPFLDHLSYLWNVPLHLQLIECNDSKNKIRSYNYVNSYPTVLINSHEANLVSSLIPIYALYREAKTASSPFYKFLCYFKILEGVYTHLRPILFKSAAECGVKIVTQRELVPNLDELAASHPDLIGKSVKDVFDNRFTALFRNQIAHYFLDSGSVLNVSHASALEKFSSELFAIETCARIVIRSQEAYEVQLGRPSA